MVKVFEWVLIWQEHLLVRVVTSSSCALRLEHRRRYSQHQNMPRSAKSEYLSDSGHPKVPWANGYLAVTIAHMSSCV